MAPWVKKFFLEVLPKYLCLQRPSKDEDQENNLGCLGNDILMDHSENQQGGVLVTSDMFEITGTGQTCHIHGLNHLSNADITNTLDFGIGAHYPSIPSPIFMSDNEAGLRNRLSNELMKKFPTEIEKSATHARFVAQRLRNKDRFAVVCSVIY